MTDLPVNVEFAASYLDSVMEDEQPEIRRQWQVVRQHLTPQPAEAIEATTISNDGTIRASVRVDIEVDSVTALYLAAFGEYTLANVHRQPQDLREEFESMYGTVERPDMTGLLRLLFDSGRSMSGVSVQDSYATIHAAPSVSSS